MRLIATFLLSLFVVAAIAQAKPTPQECKQDPKRAGCQK